MILHLHCATLLLPFYFPFQGLSGSFFPHFLEIFHDFACITKHLFQFCLVEFKRKAWRTSGTSGVLAISRCMSLKLQNYIRKYVPQVTIEKFSVRFFNIFF